MAKFENGDKTDGGVPRREIAPIQFVVTVEADQINASGSFANLRVLSIKCSNKTVEPGMSCYVWPDKIKMQLQHKAGVIKDMKPGNMVVRGAKRSGPVPGFEY